MIFNMKYFIAHKVSGEDHIQLEKEIKIICSAIKKSGHQYYCSFLDDKMRSNKNKNNLLENAFNKIDEADGIMLIVKSEDKSEGMLIELGYALAKGKKVILLIHNNVKKTYLREISDSVVEFSNINELSKKLEQLI